MVSTKVKNAYYKATGNGEVVEEEITEGEKSGNPGPGGRRIDSIGEDCPVSVGRQTYYMCTNDCSYRCYEEMTLEEEKTGRLTFDESLAGCGKGMNGHDCIILANPISVAL